MGVWSREAVARAQGVVRRSGRRVKVLGSGSCNVAGLASGERQRRWAYFLSV